MKNLSILIVDDDEDDAFLTQSYLQQGMGGTAMKINRAATFSEAVSCLATHQYDICLFDYYLGESDGLQLMRKIRACGIMTPVILLTGQGDEEIAVSAIKEGASDYLSKRQLSPDLVCHAIRSSLELYKAEERRKQTEKALRESEENYSTIIRTAAEGFWVFNKALETIDLNDSLCRLLGYSREEILGRSPFEFISEDNKDRAKKGITAIMEQGIHSTEIIFHSKDGRDVYVIFNGAPLRDADGKPVKTVAFLTDITTLKKTEKRLGHMAHYDQLTGLPNRVLCFDRLHQAITRAKRYPSMIAVLFIDLDHFKSINDTLGHDIGDLLLIEAARRLSSSVRESDTTARLGGDEFLIILESIVKKEDVDHVAKKIIASLSRPYRLKGHPCKVEASIGISLYPHDGDDKELLIKKADLTMYQAKKCEGGRYQFYKSAMNTTINNSLSMEARLQQAVDRKEFILHYQPKIDLQSWKTVGMEALIRWECPDLGLVPPSRFIPLAEETGLIIPIGEWVIRTACKQAGIWKNMGISSFRTGMNLSRHQLDQENIAGIFSRILKETGIPGDLMDLELTESVAMRNIEKAIITLTQLNELGLDISIDDFGIGYSSLNCLRRLPIQILKIDQSFIRELTSNRNDTVIIKAIISMAHNLNLKVIAEGVETIDQLRVLRSFQCDEGQGYLFSRPMPIEEATQFLLNKGRRFDFTLDALEDAIVSEGMASKNG